MRVKQKKTSCTNPKSSQAKNDRKHQAMGCRTAPNTPNDTRGFAVVSTQNCSVGFCYRGWAKMMKSSASFAFIIAHFCSRSLFMLWQSPKNGARDNSTAPRPPPPSCAVAHGCPGLPEPCCYFCAMPRVRDGDKLPDSTKARRILTNFFKDQRLLGGTCWLPSLAGPAVLHLYSIVTVQLLGPAAHWTRDWWPVAILQVRD